MAHRAECIVVTGLGHTGTRLFVELLNAHPSVSVPMELLNRSREYSALHRYFVETVDATPIHSGEYRFDRESLFFVLDSYMRHVDKSAKFTVLKFPFYPLWCLDLIKEYFEGNISLIYCDRDLSKIEASHLRRQEDKTLFSQNWQEVFRQIKKLEAPFRQKHLAGVELKCYLKDLKQSTDNWLERWRLRWPDMGIAHFEADKVAANPRLWGETLDQIGLSKDGLDVALKLIDQERLADRGHGRLPAGSRMAGVARKAMRKLQRVVGS